MVRVRCSSTIVPVKKLFLSTTRQQPLRYGHTVYYIKTNFVIQLRSKMAGSQWTMPIIIINMGGEMVYILQQRLQAQNVTDDKANKVLLDVIQAMYTPVFMNELFKGQEMYTIAATKQIFEKLAHSSIMRLNKSSMDKLYDLMLMGFKYQTHNCASPHQILHVTLNHLEALKLIVGSDSVGTNVRNAIDSVVNIYTSFTNSQMMTLNQTLMSFFQGKKTKVSLFLQRNLQTMDGNLVLSNAGSLPYGTEKPGVAKYFEDGVIVKEKHFNMDGFIESVENFEIFDVNSSLGYNMYSKRFFSENSKLFDSVVTAGKEIRAHLSGSSSFQSSRKRGESVLKSSAKAELNLLSDLLGMTDAPSKGGDCKPFKINLFPDNSFDDKAASSSSGASTMIVIDIDGAAGAKTMQHYMADLKLRDDDDKGGGHKGGGAKGEAEDEDDLLALMDSAK